MKSNKTYLIYSKKNQKFISSLNDVSSLVFVKYGFSILYAIDILNILYSFKRKFYILTLILTLYYICPPTNTVMQILCMITLGFLAYIVEIFFLKERKYVLIATIEAKNLANAREHFIKENIFKNNFEQTSQTRGVFLKI